MLQVLFQGNGVRAFEIAAIEDDGGTQLATIGTLTGETLHTKLTHVWLATQRQRKIIFIWESHFQILPTIEYCIPWMQCFATTSAI